MRSALLLIPLLALGACERAAGPPETTAVVEDAEPAAAPGAEPAFRPASFVGRWAAEPGLCADGAWLFRTDGVSTAGEVSCAFRSVTATASGYRIDATCAAEGEETSSEITLAMTDPAPPQSMTVSGGPWAGPITLMRCPG
ncbi:hypothetical protein [Phenylobacterium zucineum]|uniref:hypothetical protein n=1 Tax=Phenylobacterium zucineum TaxID=284016 RepID=UPI0002FC57FB|nr:hypothetical protein [Phenylobacterium zucineum]